MHEASAPVEIRPLTRASKETGQLYRRDPQVEQQITEALTLDPAALVERAAVTSREDPRFLNEETLVYMIREYHDRKQPALVGDLTEALLRRCSPYIEGQLRKLGADRQEDASNDVVEMLFTRILDPSSDRGDFLQVRFWPFLNRMIADTFRRQLGLMKKAGQEVAPDWVHGAEPAGDAEPDGHYIAPVPSHGLSQEQRALMEDALAHLDEPYRTLVVLRYYDDWPVESNDPSVLTISRYYAKTPRTIRNWLNTADEQLRAWREGEL